MPELAEVEAARKSVEDHCIGSTILRVKVSDDPKVVCDSAKALEEALTGSKILQAHRKGKHLWFQLDRRPWPAFHFGMTGAISIKGVKGTKYKSSAINEDEEWPSKFMKVLMELENGVEMAFTDKRRLARVRLLQDPPTEPPISELGPDAYSEFPDENYFVTAIHGKKCPIKARLLDQTLVCGLGNWMADEALYQARIHPEKPTAILTPDDRLNLHRAIKEVVNFAVKVNADSDQFPKEWIFHQRWNKKAGSLDGNEIDFITVGGRTSAYVPALQKLSEEDLEWINASTKRKSSKKEPTVENELPTEYSTEGSAQVLTSRKRRKKAITTGADVPIEEKPANTNVDTTIADVVESKAVIQASIKLPSPEVKQGKAPGATRRSSRRQQKSEQD